MKVVKKYAAVVIRKSSEDIENVQLNVYGKSRYSSPDIIFDTEEEAINHAYQADNWATWLIIPVVTFDNF